MCGCDFPIGTICGYHRAAILELLLELKRAEAANNYIGARRIRGELNEFGHMRVAMVRQDLEEGGEEFARIGRVAQGSVFG